MTAPDAVRRKRELGYCQVTDSHGGAFHLERGEFARVWRNWTHGCRFVDTVGFHGDRMTLRLKDIDSVSDMSPEVIASALAEQRADDADDSLNTIR